MSWEEANRSFRDLFLSGGDYDTGVGGAERLSPVAAAHRILCNDFGMVPFSIYRKQGQAGSRSACRAGPGVQDPAQPGHDPLYAGPHGDEQRLLHGFGAVWNRRGPDGRIVERVPLPSDCCTIRQDRETGNISMTTAWTACSAPSPAMS